jgi:hypothetical protein
MDEYKNGYKMSRDYKRLKQLLDDGYEVVCSADYDWHDGTISRDICVGRLILGSTEEYDHYSFSCRTICYCEFYPSRYRDRNMTEEVMFKKAVSRKNIEFIDMG